MSADEGNESDNHEREPEHESSTTAATSSVTANVRQDGDESRGGAGEMVGRSFDSARNRLTQPGPKAQLTLVVGLFAVIGVGFGLTGIVAIEFIAGSATGGQFMGAFLLIPLFAILLFTGPIMGAFSGLRVADRLEETTNTIYLTSFVGTAVGYFVMVIVSVLLVSLFVGGGSATASSGGSLFNLIDLLVPLLLLAIPVGVTGLGSSFFLLRTTDR